jgi:ubiquinone/menaquinone biosynthesis C-methylase UbiE
LQANWDAFSQYYDQYIQHYMLQGFTTLAIQTKANKKRRILEVACGGGSHSLYLAKTMLQRGSVLVSTDISAQMIKLSKAKFDDPSSDYLSIPGNKFISKPEGLGDLGTHSWDLEVFI